MVIPDALKQRLLDSNLFLRLVLPLRRAVLDARAVERWERAGRPAPAPHAAKVRLILAHAAGRPVLVETGTYLGDMVAAVRPAFERVVTIELDPRLQARAQRRFARFEEVEVLQGDSGVVLHQVLATLDRPALFWLDAHYSGGLTARAEQDCPLLSELDSVLRHPIVGHAILIDDARDLGVAPSYPSLDAIKRLVRTLWPTGRVECRDDVVRITR